MRKATHNKAQIISAIKAAARRLRRTPTRSEFQRLSGIHWMKVQRLFGGYRAAVREAGLEPDPGGIRIDTAAMLVDFGRVARKAKRHPTREEYEKLGKYAGASLETRFRRWSAVREAFLEYVTRNGLEREWGDVAESLRNGPVPRRGGGTNWLKPKKSLPRIAADDRGSESLKHRGMENTEGNRAGHAGFSEMGESANGSETVALSMNPEVLPRIDADNRGSKPEPVRAEIIYPQLRGMRCVTKVMLWVMSMQQSSQQDNDQFGKQGGITADYADGRGSENICTDRSVRATQFWSGETLRTGCDTQTRAGEIIRTHRSISATWEASLERALYFPKRIIPGRPLMGAPLLPFLSRPRGIGASAEHLLMLHGMAYEPVNEMGVVFLFGMVAPLLGFRVEALQAGFPDCKAKLEVEPGRWQDVNIEFEFESRKFRDHRHDPDKCDIIVCWRHNWKACPERIQVVELSSILGVR
ncbi:MAG: homing endonuclease associated repeat-containing protein [Actinomycetota bacterium]